MTRIALLVAGTASALIATSSAQAEEGRFALGANFGTPGAGVEAQFRVTDQIVLRGGADSLKFDHDDSYSGVDYSGKLKSSTGGVFVDWHPAGGGFFVSAGGYFGDRSIELDGTPSGSTDIGGVTYTAAQIGTISGEVKQSDLQPFVGLGWDTTFSGEGGWGFRGLVGTAISESPSVRLTASGGTLSSDPTFQSRLRQEEADVRDDAKDFKYFPVAQIGLTYRF
jgi:hypothetical protein